jgi:hypothetical protein
MVCKEAYQNRHDVTMVMAYSKKPAPAVAVMAHCKGLPVRIVILKNPPKIAKISNKSGFKLLEAEGACSRLNYQTLTRVTVAVYKFEASWGAMMFGNPIPAWQSAMRELAVAF